MAEQIVIRNGTVVNAWARALADVVLADGRIRAVVEPGTGPGGPGVTEIDATGRFVLPGGVDPHCHVGFTSGAFTSMDNYRQATEAAVFGGTTTIVDFAIPRPGEVPLDVARIQQAKAAEGICDAALHACVVEWNDTVPGQLRELVDMGIVTVKMFTTYRGESMASDEAIFKVMRELRDLGGMAVVHCEANHIIEEQQDRCAESGHIAAEFHTETRPPIAETAAVATTIAMAESLGAPLYLVHQSTVECLTLAAEARRRGVTVFSESVAHHLILDDSLYDGPHPERYVCCPPLRSRAEVDELSTGVWDGSISTIGSDHCCYNTEQKLSTRHDVRAMPNGLPGVEMRMPVIFSEFVVGRGLPLERFVELCCATPARVNGLWPRKGVIQPGADGDVVIWDPHQTRVVHSEELHMATDYTPYEGRTVTGWPEVVIVNGRVLVDHGTLVHDGTPGRALPAAPLKFLTGRVAPLVAPL